MHPTSASGIPIPKQQIYHDDQCSQACAHLKATEWLLFKQHWQEEEEESPNPNMSMSMSIRMGMSMHRKVKALMDTTLKKSEISSQLLPQNMKRPIAEGTEILLSGPLVSVDGEYWIGDLSAMPQKNPR